MQFCVTRQVDAFNPDVNSVIMFLSALFQTGLGYSGLNTAKSAISSVVNIVSNVQLGTNILIRQFMKGVFNQKPSLPRYNCTWDVSTVLKYVSTSLDALNGSNLKELTLKLIMLLALTTGQRVQTLHCINVHNIDICDEHVKIRIGDVLKTSRYGKHLPELYIQEYSMDKSLCVVHVLAKYLELTRPLRGDESQLFLSYQKPYRRVTKGTLAKWIKNVLKCAGIDTSIFSPHSTRSASTSVACGKIPIDTVLRTAGWKKDCTFRKFYKRDVTNNAAFANSILSESQK